MLQHYVLFILGFVALIGGAQALVSGASSIGARLKISQMIMGLTVVALGTSLPELIVNIFASAQGNSALALGNVLGSNITNTLLVVGASAIIIPVSMSKTTFFRDIPFSLLVLLVLFLIANDRFFGRPDYITRIDGMILLILLGFFIYFTFFKGNHQEPLMEQEVKAIPIGRSIIYIIGGALGLYFGGNWIVGGALVIARQIGISETAMGLTLIAGATSLPELATSIIASKKNNTDMAMGNVIGSNIINISLVLGVTALIRPIQYSSHLNVEIGLVFLSGTLLMVFAQIGKKKRTLNRIEGIFLVLLYVLFIYFSTQYQ
ncbi:MAG: calcium/sodium antiporter [Bacteroidales bacterium]|nr:calcium/sodium antiporter [Bacteroidales bacterium]